MEEDAKKHLIGDVSANALIAVAALLDMFQFMVSFLYILVPIGPPLAVMLTWATSLVAFCIFSFWFGLLGVSYFSGKRALQRLLIGFGLPIAELLPLINMFPWITIGVALTIVTTRMAEDTGTPRPRRLGRIGRRRALPVRARQTAQRESREAA